MVNQNIRQAAQDLYEILLTFFDPTYFTKVMDFCIANIQSNLMTFALQ